MLRITTFLFSLALAGTLGAQTQYFTATLTGSQEVPPNASTSYGKAFITLNGTALSVTVNTTSFATATTAGHIHKAPVGVNGSVVIPFTQAGSTWTANVTVTAAQITDLTTGQWYCNIHTTAFPGGEIRGQVGAAKLPSTYGNGCLGTNRLTPAIGADGFACISTTFNITLKDARASSTASLLIGTSNTTFGSLTLPLALGVIGMPSCFLLTSDLGLGLSTGTDASGAAAIGIPIPLNIALANLTLYAQWFVVDVGANILGVVSSNGLMFTLQ